jgi:hypothetical protein
MTQHVVHIFSHINRTESYEQHSFNKVLLKILFCYTVRLKRSRIKIFTRSWRRIKMMRLRNNDQMTCCRRLINYVIRKHVI